MRIESITLKNFKSFRDVCMQDIPGFCVVIGANGTGKTTLFDVFGFLRNCLTHNVKHALQRRGKFREVISRGCSEQDNIEIRLQFRMALSGVDRLVTYLVQIWPETGCASSQA